jgi:8-oxo-dGTP pyrophosphatase MutT (NUDIX family)
MHPSYSCALVYDRDWPEKVAMIIKDRGPSWVIGKLTAPGGHIEPGETPLECAVREFKEETGLQEDLVWRKVLTWRDLLGYEVHLFAAAVELLESKVSGCRRRPEETEEVRVINYKLYRPDPEEGRPEISSNMKWMVHLAADTRGAEDREAVRYVTEQRDWIDPEAAIDEGVEEFAGVFYDTLDISFSDEEHNLLRLLLAREGSPSPEEVQAMVEGQLVDDLTEKWPMLSAFVKLVAARAEV